MGTGSPVTVAGTEMGRRGHRSRGDPPYPRKGFSTRWSIVDGSFRENRSDGRWPSSAAAGMARKVSLQSRLGLCFRIRRDARQATAVAKLGNGETHPTDCKAGPGL